MVNICITFNGNGHAQVSVNGSSHYHNSYHQQSSGCISQFLAPGTYSIGIVGTAGAGGAIIDITGQKNPPQINDHAAAGPLIKTYFIEV